MKIKIISNPLKQWAVELENALSEQLVAEQNNQSFTIIIGGDGTFLYNKEKVEGIAILIGSKTSKRAHINYEPESMSVDDVISKLNSFFSNPEYIELPLLSVSGIECKAINDVVVHTANHSVVGIDVYGKNFHRKLRGDGAIVSTPFGSLGYNKSVGGSEISLGMDALILSSISPILPVPPLVYRPSTTVLKVSEGEADLIIDGYCRTKFIKEITIKPSDSHIKYLKL